MNVGKAKELVLMQGHPAHKALDPVQINNEPVEMVSSFNLYVLHCRLWNFGCEGEGKIAWMERLVQNKNH